MNFFERFKKLVEGWKKSISKFFKWEPHLERRWLPWIIALGLAAALVPMFPRAHSLQFADMKEGSISARRIVAPFNFEILKTREEYSRDRELATREVYPVFVRDGNKLEEVNEQTDLFFGEVKNLRQQVLRTPESRSTLADSLFRRYSVSVLDSTYREMLVDPSGVVTLADLNQFIRKLKSIVRDLLAVGVLDLEKDRLATPDRRLKLIDENEELVHPYDDFYDLSEARAKTVEELNAEYPDRPHLAQTGFGIISYFIRPNLAYDEETHQQRIDDAMARVPLSSGFVYEDEKVVDRNERITPEIRKKLVSLATKQAEMGMEEGGIKRVLPFLGKSAFVIMLFFMLGSYIAIERPQMLKDPKPLLLVALIILLVCGITFLIRRLNVSEYLVPAALGAILLATLFDSKFGYAGMAVISLLIGGLWGNEFNLTVVSFFVGVVGVVTIKRLRDRRQFIQTILFLIGANVFAITLMGLLRVLPFREIIGQWPFGALNGLLIPIVAYGLLPLIESVFGITTDFSLLELSNLNHPLLKRLSVQAPGTYHHSIIVGNLAEAGAQAVHANSLLARVGSYYHDVGKVEKAEYFVENQMGGENPHEKLNPRMSALILMNHVKRGLEMADKYKLPQSIKDIIVQHQGTTVMSFFYRKAVSKDGSNEAAEEDYRYPGPRPQTKEAAIVMLADAVEAATRSLKGPTHSRLKGLIEDLVDGRFQEGQLDESPLTLRDLDRIKEGFLTILAGTFHARVEYPDRDDSKSPRTQSKNDSADKN